MGIEVFRTKAEELQNMNIVLVEGINEKDPQLCAIGWVEVAPHEGESAIILNEPIECMFLKTYIPTEPNKPPVPPIISMGFFLPQFGVPMTAEYFQYTHIKTFEGITPFAEAYINFLANAQSGLRLYKPQIKTMFLKEKQSQPTQPGYNQQARV